MFNLLLLPLLMNQLGFYEFYFIQNGVLDALLFLLIEDLIFGIVILFKLLLLLILLYLWVTSMKAQRQIICTKLLILSPKANMSLFLLDIARLWVFVFSSAILFLIVPYLLLSATLCLVQTCNPLDLKFLCFGNAILDFEFYIMALIALIRITSLFTNLHRALKLQLLRL